MERQSRVVGFAIDRQGTKERWPCGTAQRLAHSNRIVVIRSNDCVGAKLRSCVGAGENAGYAPIATKTGGNARFECMIIRCVEIVEVGGGAQLPESRAGGDIVEFAFHQVATDHRAVVWAKGVIALAKCLDRSVERVA